MMLEIGGYLSLYKPDICRSIISNLLISENRDCKFSILYAAYMAFNILSKDMQKVVIAEVEKLPHELDEKVTFINMLDAFSFCNLCSLRERVGVLHFYKHLCNGHESCIVEADAWYYNVYFSWCIEQFRKNSKPLNLHPIIYHDFLQAVDSYKSI